MEYVGKKSATITESRFTRITSKPIEILTENESTKLIEWSYNRSMRPRYIRQRDTTMIVLMLDAGLRVGECSKLPRGSVMFAKQPGTSIVIPKSISKNKRERVIPMSERLTAFIREMIKEIWIDPVPHPAYPCFCGNCDHVELSTRQIERIVKHNSLIAIGRAIHPHILRHTFATKMMGRTSMRVVQELLGHKHISSTQIYTHPNQEDLRRAINGKPAPENSQ